MAAWFHDTGYTQTEDDHEKASAQIATDFLAEQKVSQEEISQVGQLILATKLSTKPQNLLEEILRDADSEHLGSEKYFEISEDLKKEQLYKTGLKTDELDWQNENLNFFNQHQFYTASAKKLWQTMKDINVLELQDRLDKLEKKSKKKQEEATTQKRGRGVETLFRVQLINHLELSPIADTKANILLSVNAIIIFGGVV